MANDKRVNIGIGFNVDRSGLNNLKSELTSLQNMTLGDLVEIKGTQAAIDDLEKIQKAAGAVQTALEKSFNTKLNTQNLDQFNAELQKSGYTLTQIQQELYQAGAAGQNAFRNITTELLTTNRYLKQSSQWLDKMADTMANSVRWTIASTALNTITGSVQKAYSFTKQLDSSLNDIRIVTGKSADEMARFAKEATTAAKNLGSTTTAYTKAALIYEQQGLGAADVAARSDVTTKVSNVTGQSADEVSEQLTAIWNGYKVSAAEAELYIDKVSAVAATTAADLEELSQGMGKVASAANAMGVDIDQLNASLATIISVTRQDANAVGTSLKTIYARMGDLMVDGEDEFGVKLGDVSSKLKTMGIDILDTQGQMRNMGEVIEEVASKWDTWTEAQQQAAAVALAGKRQYNNLIALFENWDMYEEAKSTSKGGVGELQKQQDIYMESMEAHLNQLKTEAEDLYQTLLDPEGLNPMIDALTEVVGLINNMIQSLGGGVGLLNTLGAIGMNVFSKQITKGLTSAVQNIAGFKDNLRQAAAQEQIIKELEITDETSERQQKILEIAKKRQEIIGSLTEEEIEASNVLLKRTNELYKQQDILEEQKKTIESFIGTLAQYDEQGNLLNTEDVSTTFTSLKMGLQDSATSADASIAEMSMTSSLQTLQARTMGLEDYLNNETNYENQEEYNRKFDEYIIAKARQVELEEKLAEIQEKSSVGDTIAEMQKYAGVVEDSNQKIQLHVEQQESVKKLLAIINDAYDEHGEILENATQDQVKAAAAALKEYKNILGQTDNQLNKASKNVSTIGKEIKKTNQKVEELEESGKQMIKSFNLTKALEGVTALVGGVANLTSGVKTLIGLGDIWNNEDLTAGEKLLQTLTSLGFALPQIISGYNSLKNAGGQLITSLTTQATATVLANSVMKQSNEELQKASYWKGVYSIISGVLTEEEKKHFVALTMRARAGNQAAITELKQIAAEKLHQVSLKGLTAGFTTMGAAAWASLGPYLVIVLAVTAALAALTAIVLLAAKAYNKDAEAAKQAAEAAKALSDEYKATKAAYEELKQSISDYKDAQAAIEELTVGTQEWRDAIQDANTQVLELIKSYPILAKYLKNEDGRLTLGEGGLIAALEQKEAAVNAAFQKSIASQQAANNAALTSRATNLGRQIKYYSYATDSYYTTSSTQIKDIAARSMEEDNADMWASYAKFNKVLDGYSKEQIDALWENSDKLQALCEEMAANTEANKSLDAALIQSALSNNKDYQESEYQEGINQILSAQKAEDKKIAESKYDDMTKKQMMQEYANRMIASGEWKAEDVQVKRNKIVVAGEDKFVKQWDTVKNLLAEEDALKNIKKTDVAKLSSEIGESVEKIGAFGKTLTAGAKKSNSIGEVTAADYAKAKDALINGLDEFANNYKELGYEQLSDLEAALKASIADYEETSQNIRDGLSEATEKLLYKEDGSFAIGGLTLDEQRGYAEAMNEIQKRFGDKSVTQFNDLFNSLGDAGKDLAIELGKIDSVEGLEEFKKSLAEEGKLAPELVDSLSITLRDSLDLFKDFSKEASQAYVANIKSIFESVKEMGDTIDADKYEELDAGMKKFFSETEDGMYALNMSAREFAKQARLALLEKRQKEIDEAEGKLTTAKVTTAEKQGNITSAEGAKNQAGINSGLAYESFKKIEKEYTAQDGTKILGVSSDNRAATLITTFNLEANVGVDKNDVNTMYELAKKNVDQTVLASYATTLDNIKSDMEDGVMSERNFRALHDLYWKAYEKLSYTDVSTANTAYDNAVTEYTNAQQAEEAAQEEVNSVYEKYASSATLEELDQWLADKKISEDTYKEQLYRFDIELDFGVDPLEELDRAFDESGKRIDKLKEKAENLFGDALKTNLQAQATELANGFEILNQKATELSNKTKFEGTSYNSVKAAFEDIVSSAEMGGLGIKLGDLSQYYDAKTGRFTNLTELEEKISSSGNVVSTADRAMVQNLFDAISAHNTDIDTLLATTDSIEEQNQLIKENALAIFDYTYQNAHDFNEVKKAYNDFLREFSAEEDDFGAQATLAEDDYLTAYDDLIQSQAKVTALKNLTYDTEKQGYILGEDILTQEEYEAELIKEQEKYQEYALTLKERLQELQDIEVQQIEEIAEQYSVITDSIESINELLEHQISIQSLLKGENSQEVLVLYEQQNANLNSILTTQKEAYAYWENEVKNGGLTGEALDEAKAKWAEAGQAVAATSAELAQSYSDQFARIIQSSVDAVFNGLDELKEQYDWISSQSEKTFDSLSGAMEIQKAATAWTKAMYDNKNLKAQSQMNTFIEEEVALLKEKDKLTQYDLDRAQARFELLQAQIALEEAQANKTSMRLVRGADGSYGYQYVADSAEIMEKQQAVNNAAQAVMDLDKEEIKTNFDEIYDTTQEFLDKYIAAWEDREISEVERETLQSIWDSLMAEVGDTDDLVENLRESMQEAAKAAGLEDYTQLSDDEMKALFPELDTRYYETLKTLASTGFTQEKFNELLAVGDTEAAKAILIALTGLDLTSYIGDKDSGMTWLYQGMSAEAKTSLDEGKTALNNIKTAVDECQSSFDLLEGSILAVATSLQSLSLGRFDIIINNSNTTTNRPNGSAFKATVASMDTGGYTGEWGSWGKDAILHEKELVLNKVDTQNILQSVSIVRDISGYISALSAALDSNLGRTMANITEQNQPVQNVEIHAEFPNATDKNSIKEAFEEILAEAEQMLYENTR